MYLTKKIEGKRRVISNVFDEWRHSQHNQGCQGTALSYNPLIRIIDQINFECGMDEGVFDEGNPYWIHEGVRITLKLEIKMILIIIHPENEEGGLRLDIPIYFGDASCLTDRLDTYLDAYRCVWRSLRTN